VTEELEELDLSAIMASYKGENGQPPYHPTMMVALLLYGYAVRVGASRDMRGSE
jgi:transposase